MVEKTTKLLIAICSCQRDKNLGCHDIVRQEWGKNVSDIADVRFFIGGPKIETLEDEVWIDCPDDYENLTLKTRQILLWMLTNGYDYLFKCDNDTRLFLKEFRQYDYKAFDYSGIFFDYGKPELMYASGNGYFLSRKACEIASRFEDLLKPGAEDVTVGKALQSSIMKGEITAHHISDRRAWTGDKGAGEIHKMVPEHVLIQFCTNGWINGKPRRVSIDAAKRLVSLGLAMQIKE